jgi:hypothetical protein
MPHVFEEILGDAYARLPPVVRRLHEPDPVAQFEGRVDVEGAATAAGAAVARRLGLPPAGRDLPAKVTVARDGGVERIRRDYGGRIFETRFAPMAGRRGRAIERFGPLTLEFAVAGSEQGIDFSVAQCRIGPLPLPKRFTPLLAASERAGADGTYRFDVEIGLPLVGRLVRYRGWLRPVSATRS